MSKQWCILIVEDEERLNRNIVASLRKDRYFVQGVSNGTEAIRTLWSEEYHVVLCDLKASSADTFELVQWIRSYRPDTRVIIVGSVLTRTQALEIGAASYVEPPLSLHTLKEELRRLLHQTGFSASLDSFDLLDVIQIITMSRKTIALVVNTGLEERGLLRFQSGELVWAEYGTLLGEEAFFALAAHKNGTVIHQPWNDRITPNVTQPLSRLIFQALQYREKYAAYQQLSGEHAAIPNAPAPRLFEQKEIDDSPFLVALQEEIDDRPFLVATEAASPPAYATPAPVPAALTPIPAEPIQPPPASQRFQQKPAALTPIPAEPIQQEQFEHEPKEQKEWWQQSQKHSRLNKLGDTNGSTSRPPAGYRQAPAIPRKTDEATATPPSAHKTPASDRPDLPSWLMDQPTQFEMPVLRPPSPSGASYVPATPLNRPTPAEWQPPQSPQVAPPSMKTTGPRKHITGSQKLQRTEAPVRQTSSPEWQPPHEQRLPVQSGPLQPLAPSESLGMVNGAGTLERESTIPRTPTTRPAKRSYPALVNALQSLGYSVPGFVATAIVGMDGQPIAQVAIDELDISPMCRYLGSMVQNILLALDGGKWGQDAETMITSSLYHILVRIVGSEQDAFHVLMTTHSAPPKDSLEAMANVEGAIESAL